MTDPKEVLRTTLRDALSGRGAHVPVAELFDGLDWQAAGARPEGARHTVFRLLNHLIYWQEFALEWLDGRKPQTPEHDEDSWPGSDQPADRKSWQARVGRFKTDRAELERRVDASTLLAQIGPKTAGEILQIVASHNSYHAGQVVALRRALGAWPPPSGGFTW